MAINPPCNDRRKVHPEGIREMKIDFFGDSYDIVKRFLLQTIAPGARWAAFPMFTHAVTQDELVAFETFLGVDVVSPGVLAPDGDRVAHLAALPHQQYIFLDPDTGIRLRPCGGRAAANYLFGPEVIDLCLSAPGRLVLVFDQSVPRGRERKAMADKLAYFAERGVHGFAYISHVCFVVLSASEPICAEAAARLAAAALPVQRILRQRGS